MHTHTCEAGTPLVAAYADGHRQGRTCHGKPRLARAHAFGFSIYRFDPFILYRLTPFIVKRSSPFIVIDFL